MSGYKIVNEFHHAEKFTRSENPKTIAKIVRSLKPRDCQSATTIYQMENGEIVGVAHLVDGEIRVEKM